MANGYTREDILNECKSVAPSLLYKQKFINYRGKTADTDEYYTEVAAEYVCDNFALFDSEIKTITREANYKTPTHDGKYNPNSNRDEEIIAMQMYRKEYDHIGKVIDYQTPLKNKQADEAGKLDLLAFDGKTLRILELKKPDSDETMLRCVLEGYTYIKIVNTEKLISNFELNDVKRVVACPFVFAETGSVPYEEYCDLDNRPQLKRLMKILNSVPYFITGRDGSFKVYEK